MSRVWERICWRERHHHVKMIETQKRHKNKWDIRPHSVMGWVNVGAWLVCMLLWLSPRQVIVHKSLMTTNDQHHNKHKTSSSPQLTTGATTVSAAAAAVSTPERKITSTTSTSSQPQQQQRTTSASPVFLVQSFTKGHHNPQLQRSVLSFTTVPSELTNMVHMIKRIVTDVQYNIFDAIHINVPWTALRFQ